MSPGFGPQRPPGAMLGRGDRDVQWAGGGVEGGAGSRLDGGRSGPVGRRKRSAALAHRRVSPQHGPAALGPHRRGGARGRLLRVCQRRHRRCVTRSRQGWHASVRRRGGYVGAQTRARAGAAARARAFVRVRAGYGRPGPGGALGEKSPDVTQRGRARPNEYVGSVGAGRDLGVALDNVWHPRLSLSHYGACRRPLSARQREWPSCPRPRPRPSSPILRGPRGHRRDRRPAS